MDTGRHQIASYYRGASEVGGKCRRHDDQVRFSNYLVEVDAKSGRVSAPGIKNRGYANAADARLGALRPRGSAITNIMTDVCGMIVTASLCEGIIVLLSP